MNSIALRRVLDRIGSYRVIHALSQRSYQTQGTKIDKSDSRLDFNNTVEAYQSKTTRELIRHFVILSVFNFDSIVNRSHKLVKLARKCLGQTLFHKLMKMTIFGQFVAGEDIVSIHPVIKRYRKNGVRSILDYAVEEDISDEKEVILETRTKADGGDTQLTMAPHDAELFPQFKPTVTSADVTDRASARTYFYATEQKCDDVMKNFLACVNMTADTTEPGDTAFAAIKLTGLGRVEFLLRLSEIVEGTQCLFMELADKDDIFSAKVTPQSFHDGLTKKKMSLSASEIDCLYSELDIECTKAVGVFEWMNRFQPGNELYKIFQAKKGVQGLAVMEDHDLEQMQTVLQRAHTVAECAEERNVRLMIDAEQSYFQPAIRHITVYNLMPKYNRKYPIIFNTIQCYLKNARDTIRMDVEYSKICGFSYGVKLVRGAYLEQEREGALEKKAPDPVWSSKDETDECYDNCLEYLMQHVHSSNVNMMVATHNEDSVRKAINFMKMYGINKQDGSVVFGQLLGMCDHITLILGKYGYSPYKYMPYGQVDDVLPYLIRRAFENRGMLKGAEKERKLVRAELWRRVYH